MKCLKAHGNFKVCKARVQEVKIKKMEQWTFHADVSWSHLNLGGNHKHKSSKNTSAYFAHYQQTLVTLNAMVTKTVAAWSTVF